MANEDKAMTLDELVRKFESDLEQQERRGKRRVIAIGVLVLIVLGYLGWLYSTVTQLNAEAVSQIASGYIRVNLPRFRESLRGSLTDAAPGIAAHSRQAILQAPRFVREQIEATLPYGSNSLAVRFEDELNLSMDGAVTELAKATPRRDAKTLISDARAAFRGMVAKIADESQAEFSAELANLRTRLLEIQGGEKLSERQKTERDLIRASLALMERYKVAGAIVDAEKPFE